MHPQLVFRPFTLVTLVISILGLGGCKSLQDIAGMVFFFASI
ncbi:MAG: hypothetical protein ACKVP2_14305 [Burkholderiales bacterium]